ncbi:MAG: Gfo/Idh/MocA family oxidoreductase [Clostridia bacterium]|nr:Gfo/Idh/MocA family oxidoreductase [Clostridia bacterium]
MNELKVGIIGIGNMGSTHAKSIYEGNINRLKLVAVCDIDQNKLKLAKEQFPSVLTYEDFNELLNSKEVDAVIIATPHFLHTEIAIKAFEAGLHVLTEKPAGVRASDVLKMNVAAEKSNKVFGIMWNQRTNPLFQKAKELVENGTLGTMKRLVWIITNWYRTQNYYDSASWRATWSGEGGGVLLNQAPHNLDLWQWIFGMPDAIYATCDVGKWHNIEVEDDATIIGYYKNGATATFITSTGEYPGTNRLEISGSKGKMVLEKGTITLILSDEDERTFCYSASDGHPNINITKTVIEQTEKETAHNGILQNFTDAVLDGTPLLASGFEGIKEITLSNAAYLSAWTGKKVELPLDCKAFDSELEKRIATSMGERSVSAQKAAGQSSRWQVNW